MKSGPHTVRVAVRRKEKLRPDTPQAYGSRTVLVGYDEVDIIIEVDVSQLLRRFGERAATNAGKVCRQAGGAVVLRAVAARRVEDVKP